ncbi:MAG: Uma2 family endonuclease [Gemmatimonadota bacterium]|nr:MAG: Uma2 family endonuclease [Gemmatimonadota bacterium]
MAAKLVGRVADRRPLLGDFLAAGTRLAWLVDPRRREVRVFRSDGSMAVIGEDGALDGEDVVPGFSCPLAAVLP